MRQRRIHSSRGVIGQSPDRGASPAGQVSGRQGGLELRRAWRAAVEDVAPGLLADHQVPRDSDGGLDMEEGADTFAGHHRQAGEVVEVLAAGHVGTGTWSGWSRQ